jgi:hypothetical protein
LRVNPREPIEAAFNRAEHGIQEGALAREDSQKIATDRFGK